MGQLNVYREIYRKRRIKEQEKRCRKYMKKRQTFCAVFFKRWAVWLILCIIISCVGTGYAFSYMKQLVYAEYRNAGLELEKSFGVLQDKDGVEGRPRTEEENKQLFMAFRYEMLSSVYNFDFAATLYDEDMNPVCDSTEGLMMRSQEIGSGRDTYSYYECPGEALDGEYLRLKWETARATHDNVWNHELISYELPDYFVVESGVYIKDDQVRIGEAEVHETTDEYDDQETVQRMIDCTPTDISGYEYRSLTELISTNYIWFVVGGNKKDSPAVQNIKQLLERDNADEQGYFDHVEWSSEHFPKLAYAEYSKIGMDGKNYILAIGASFDFWEVCGRKCILAYCSLFLLSLLAALLMARIKWIRLSTGYQVEDYRRNLTNAMAHDLKSPLMAVSGMAENLKNNIHGEKREYYADAILENVKYMNRIIDHTLELSKVEQGNLTMHREAFSLKPMLENLLARYEEELERKGIFAEIEGDLAVTADTILFAQAVDNVLSNAVKFCAEQGYITVECEPGGLHISNTYHLKPNEKLQPEELVKPFVCGDASRSGKKGTGIGLTIAKNILEMHGYQMQLSYDAGMFSVFIKIA